jgi:hypothetical protein
VVDLELKIRVRDDDLVAARGANRELVTRLNHHTDWSPSL